MDQYIEPSPNTHVVDTIDWKSQLQRQKKNDYNIAILAFLYMKLSIVFSPTHLKSTNSY